MADFDSEFNDIYENEIEKENTKTRFEEIPIDEIKFDPKGEFQNLFPLDEKNISEIASDIEKKGFIKSQAITLISITLEGGEYFVGDGHNRIEACRRADVEKVPVYRRVFTTRKEAKLAMLDLQLKRRNLSDGLKLKTIALYEQLLGKSQRGEGKTSEKIADALDISERTASKNLAILHSGDQELIDDVLSNKKSVNKGYKELQQKKKQKQSSEKPSDDLSIADDISDSLEDHSGEPHGLVITDHSDGIERPYKAPYEEDSTDRFIQEKNIQVEEARKEGFADGFYKALCFALGEVVRGRSPKEVFDDERVSDLGKYVIPKFELPPEDEDAFLSLGDE